MLYISYNTQPGWAQMVPVRDLLTEHNEVMGAPGRGIVPRIEDSLEFVGKMFDTNPNFCKANPQVVDRIKRMKEQNRNYLAHEYFNRDWLPMSFTAMADWLEPAKLNFACSTHYTEQIEAINLSAEQLAFLQGVTDPMFKETVRDFMVNQQFRRDYWVRGARELSPLERAEGLREQRVLLVTPRADVSLKINTASGEASLHDAVYLPILDYLADHKVRSIGQIEKAMAEHGLQFAQVVQAVFVLVGVNTLQAVQDDAVISRARKQTDKLNLRICTLARGRTDINYLASPVTGGASQVNRINQLFLLARGLGRKTPADWALYAADVLFSQGQRILKGGVMIEPRDEVVDELTAQALVFADKQLPILKAMGVVS
ncbi:methyltransferase regulatory domain-containing protein [Rugamonas sp. DEMB1]|uniref:methyltransferase regulatory domain-containing protein n=1 Tax=Rugamonas sp. DEMB1 TaxID=3039386 RepID=UPI002449CBD9|nr:methyltransferase regulatory domain-containing protein [Rugamonas sp. DEMB1]WGG51385.1 methyltransferase regulatory domain-containing protein [Rugamonas sp. DEMB1]